MRTRNGLAAALGALLATACDVNQALERLQQARHLSADLDVQFSKAASASNRAVMAETDEASAAFAREAEQAKAAIPADAKALRPMLLGLGYEDEARLLDEFDRRFEAYAALDRTILELAVENTNVKAQRLSFGPAQQEADAFRDALAAVAPADPANAWHVRALIATAVAGVREIQALQAPHIADLDDAVMTRLEQRMSAAETAARGALEGLRGLARPGSRARLASAAAALDRFMEVHARVTALSRRNTNARSLVLSLDRKAPLVTACEESLTALRDRLAKRGHRSSRY